MRLHALALAGALIFPSGAIAQQNEDITDVRTWERYEREQAERLRGLETERERLERLGDPERFASIAEERAADLVERAIKTTAGSLTGRPGSLSKTAKETIAATKSYKDFKAIIDAENEFTEQLDGKALAQVQTQITKTKNSNTISKQIIGALKSNAARASAAVGKGGTTAPSLLDRLAAAIGREQQKREAVARAKAEAEKREQQAREREGRGADGRVERPERGDRPRPERGERPEKPERPERQERPERPERPDRGDKGPDLGPLT